MRMIRVLAMLGVGGLGLFGANGTLAQPLNGNAIGTVPATGSLIAGAARKCAEQCVRWSGGGHNKRTSHRTARVCAESRIVCR
jgi:hypothetical protein